MGRGGPGGEHRRGQLPAPQASMAGVTHSGDYTDPMDAAPWLAEIGHALKDANLEAVLIGNAAAALQGAPVTTVDFDFMFRKTAGNLRKLKSFAVWLDAIVLRPYYPASD